MENVFSARRQEEEHHFDSTWISLPLLLSDPADLLHFVAQGGECEVRAGEREHEGERLSKCAMNRLDPSTGRGVECDWGGRVEKDNIVDEDAKPDLTDAPSQA